MRFSACFACPACLLRFERRPHCPGCGGASILPLTSPDERAAFRRATHRIHGGGRSATLDLALLRLAQWVPSSLWVPLAFGALMVAPALYGILFDRTLFLNMWLSTAPGDGARVFYEGLSGSGGAILALGAAGVLVLATAFVPRLAQRATARARRAPIPPLRPAPSPSR